mgnify:CR=1 FL=1
MPDKPETESKVVKADIPPMGIMLILFSIALFIMLTPGSLMQGVPASLIIAAEFPFNIFSIYLFILFSTIFFTLLFIFILENA